MMIETKFDVRKQNSNNSDKNNIRYKQRKSENRKMRKKHSEIENDDIRSYLKSKISDINYLKPGIFVRIVDPKYLNDIGQIIDVNIDSGKILIKLVPRINYRDILSFKIKTQSQLNAITSPYSRIPHNFFDSELFPSNQKQAKIKVSWAENGYVDGIEWDGDKYIGKFLYKQFLKNEIYQSKVHPEKIHLFKSNLANFEQNDKVFMSNFRNFEYENFENSDEYDNESSDDFCYEDDTDFTKKFEKTSKKTVKFFDRQIRKFNRECMNQIPNENNFKMHNEEKPKFNQDVETENLAKKSKSYSKIELNLSNSKQNNVDNQIEHISEAPVSEKIEQGQNNEVFEVNETKQIQINKAFEIKKEETNQAKCNEFHVHEIKENETQNEIEHNDSNDSDDAKLINSHKDDQNDDPVIKKSESEKEENAPFTSYSNQNNSLIRASRSPTNTRIFPGLPFNSFDDDKTDEFAPIEPVDQIDDHDFNGDEITTNKPGARINANLEVCFEEEEELSPNETDTQNNDNQEISLDESKDKGLLKPIDYSEINFKVANNYIKNEGNEANKTENDNQKQLIAAKVNYNDDDNGDDDDDDIIYMSSESESINNNNKNDIKDDDNKEEEKEDERKEESPAPIKTSVPIKITKSNSLATPKISTVERYSSKNRNKLLTDERDNFFVYNPSDEKKSEVEKSKDLIDNRIIDLRSKLYQRIDDRFIADERDRNRNKFSNIERFVSSDRYDDRGRYDSRDRFDNRDRFDDRYRFDDRDRYDDRDRFDDRDRYDDRYRFDDRNRFDDRYRYDDRDRFDDRYYDRDKFRYLERYDARDRLDDMYRLDYRDRYNDRDRFDDNYRYDIERFDDRNRDRYDYRDRFDEQRKFHEGERERRALEFRERERFNEREKNRFDKNELHYRDDNKNKYREIERKKPNPEILVYDDKFRRIKSSPL